MSESTENIPHTKAVRNRKSQSCTECRRRKKLCDRRVPQCNQCIARGTVGECRWGDERDAEWETAAKSPQTMVRPAMAIRQAQHQQQHHRHQIHYQLNHQDNEQQRQQLQKGGNKHAKRTVSATTSAASPASASSTSPRTMATTSSSTSAARTATTAASSPVSPVSYTEQSLMYELSRGEISATEAHESAIRPSPPSARADRPRSPSSSSSSSSRSSGSGDRSRRGSLKHSTREEEEKVRNSQWQDLDQKLTLTQAKTLIELFFNGDMFTAMVDDELVLETLSRRIQARPHGILAELRADQPDLYALMAYLCASSLFVIPQTYAITLGLVERGDDVIHFVKYLDTEAQRAIASLRKPTFITMQAHVLFQLNLAHRVDIRNHGESMDSIIRMARCLGMDRLGTVEQDEATWRAMDLANAPQPPAMEWSATTLPAMKSERSWAANTFLRRDCRARNLGRLHWLFLKGKDWASAQLLGSYSVYTGSYTTGLPKVYREPRGDPFDAKQEHMYKIVEVSLSASRRFADLCADAEALGQSIDYDGILKLDADLMQALNDLPEWLQVDKVPMRVQSRARMEAVMVSTTLWHRLVMIHRPFLLLSRTQPERYGLSSTRSWECALMCIKVMQGSDMPCKGLLHVFRMAQAALVLISHLFLKSVKLNMQEIVEVHEQIQYVISTAKHLEGMCDPKSAFAGQGKRLESVLVAASRTKSETTAALSEQGPPCAAAAMTAARVFGATTTRSVPLQYSSSTHSPLPTPANPSPASVSLLPVSSSNTTALVPPCSSGGPTNYPIPDDTALDEHLMRLLFETGVVDPSLTSTVATTATTTDAASTFNNNNSSANVAQSTSEGAWDDLLNLVEGHASSR